MMGVQIDLSSPVFKKVLDLKSKFSSWIKNVGLEVGAEEEEETSSSSSATTTGLTPGQMLLMGFNGLFEKLETDATTMYKAIQGELSELV